MEAGATSQTASRRSSRLILRKVDSIRADQDASRAAQPTRDGVGPPDFRGAAKALQSSAAYHEVCISGPSETGKTYAALYYLDSLLRDHKNSQAVIVRKVRVTLYGSALQTYQKIIDARGDVTPYGGKTPEWFDYDNGSRLWVAGMDNPGKALSSERDFIYENQAEELTQDDHETLTTRATGRAANAPFSQIIMDCNPGPADHWILKRRDSKALHLLESRHEDNPTLFDEHGVMTERGILSMRTLDALTGVRKQRLRYGRWVGAEGQFFEAWDDDKHTCDPFPIPRDWPVWGAFDYGFVHNTAFGVFTRNEGRVYLIGEHVQNKATVAQHAGAIKALCARLGVALPSQIVAGHDVFSNRGDSQGVTIAEQYAQHGIALERADIDRINGAAALMERLGNATQPPTLQLFQTCHRTIATVPAMVHDPRRPEDVLKVDSDAEGNGGDDAYDMLRYGVMLASSFIPTQAPNPMRQGPPQLVYVPGKGIRQI